MIERGFFASYSIESWGSISATTCPVRTFCPSSTFSEISGPDILKARSLNWSGDTTPLNDFSTRFNESLPPTLPDGDLAPSPAADYTTSMLPIQKQGLIYHHDNLHLVIYYYYYILTINCIPREYNILLKSIVPVPTGFQSVPSDNFSDIRIKMTNGSNQPPLPFRFPDRRG
mgnify:CR=1 FL=1